MSNIIGVPMNGSTSVKLGKEYEKQFAEFYGRLKEHLTLELYGIEQKRWLVDARARLTLIQDATNFYNDIRDELKHQLRDEDVKKLALQLSLDKNKCAVNIFKDEGLPLKFISKAREITGVRTITNSKEYVASQMTFLVNYGELDKERGEKISKIASEILEIYEKKKAEHKIISLGVPTLVSAVAIYDASYIADNPLVATTLERVLKVSAQEIHSKSDDLIFNTMPEKFLGLKGKKWKQM